MKIIWCMVPEIVLVILDSFLPFYPPKKTKNQNFEKMKQPPGDIIILHMCNINDNHMMYGSRDMERDRQNHLSFWTIVYRHNITKNQILKNWKNAWRYHYFTQVHQNHDHMLYSSWDMTPNGCKCYFSFWATFCPFTSLTTWKIKIFKKWSKLLEISSFYNSVPKIMITCYTVPEIWCVTDVIIFILPS